MKKPGSKSKHRKGAGFVVTLEAELREHIEQGKSVPVQDLLQILGAGDTCEVGNSAQVECFSLMKHC